MKIRPLETSIRPNRFLNKAAEPDGGSGGDSSPDPSPAQPQGLGSTFSKLLADIRGEPASGGTDGGDSGSGSEGDGKSKADGGNPPPDVPPDASKKDGEKAPVKKEEGKAPNPLDVPDDALTPPAKKEEAKPSAEGSLPSLEDMTKGMSDNARSNFKKQRDHYESELTKVRAELDAAKKEVKTELPAETKQRIADLEAANAEMTKALERIGAERSPTFQKKFVKPRADIINSLKEHVQEIGGDVAGMEKALKITDRRARSEALEAALGDDATEIDKATVGSLVATLLKLDRDAGEFLAQSKENMHRATEEDLAAQRAEMERTHQAREARFVEVAQTMGDDHFLLRVLPDGHPSKEIFETRRGEIFKKAQNFLFTAEGFDDFAKASVQAAMVPTLQEIVLYQQGELKKLTAQVKEFTGAEPGVTSGGDKKQPVADGGEHSSFAKRVMSGMKGEDAA